jgi:cytochrome c-type biogenesis protein CcmH
VTRRRFWLGPGAAFAAIVVSAGWGSVAVAQENNASPGIASPAQGAAPDEQTSLSDVEDEVMCPVCGTLLALSQSPQADRERAFIQHQIAAGRSKDEIKDALVAEYGSEVLATPDTEGFDLAAWLVPGVAIVAAGVAIFFGLRRWRRDGRLVGKGEPAAIDPEDQERLDSDIARYDL